jgi:hypothetical protein
MIPAPGCRLAGSPPGEYQARELVDRIDRLSEAHLMLNHLTN